MIKKIILTSLLTLFVATGFAQQNLREVEWSATNSVLPTLVQGEDGYYVHGDLPNTNNYFLSGEETETDAKDYYIKFGNFSNLQTETRIYLGADGTNTKPTYYGDLTAELAGKISFNAYYAGPIAKADVNVGNVTTIITGTAEVNFEKLDSQKDSLVSGGGYLNATSKTLSQISTTLTIGNGSFRGDLWGNGVVDAGTIKTSNNSKVSITNAEFSGGGYIGAGTRVHTLVKNTSEVKKSIIGDGAGQDGTLLSLGANTTISGGYYILGGSYAFRRAATSEIIGGSSVKIDGATIGVDAKSYIIGGAHASGSGSSGLATSTVDNTSVIILSGTFNADVYGGSYPLTSMNFKSAIRKGCGLFYTLY